MAEIGLEALKSEVTKVARPQEDTIAQRMEANMQRLENKIENVFEALTELIRSRNRNTATLPMTDSDKKTEETGSRPTSTNLDGRSVSGDRNHPEPRQEFLKEAQTPEEAEFRLQQLIASSKETERRMQRLYERNQQSMIAYQRQLEEYWKQDEIEERERSINQSFEEPIQQGTDRGFEVSADCVLGKLDPELVDKDGGEPELVQEEQITNLSQEINPNMHLIQEPKYLQHHCESSKVIPPPLQDVAAEVTYKELGKLVDLLIELIEIRLANGRTSSMMDIGLCPMEFLETYDAHNLFDKVSEPILPTNVTSGDILGKPRPIELDELDFGSLIFYPGGEKHKRKLNDSDGILIHENGMVSKACKVLTAMLESANEMMTKSDELLPQCESYTAVVFDPGGAYVWLRICHQLMLPVHWEPGGFDVADYEIGGCRVIDMGSTGVVDYKYSSTDALFCLQCIKDRLILMPFDRGRSTEIPIGPG